MIGLGSDKNVKALQAQCYVKCISHLDNSSIWWGGREGIDLPYVSKIRELVKQERSEVWLLFQYFSVN